ncbi:hypothetical protein LCGC14_1651120 [marine sediment metagenome]|uniref:Uncharacterized protein n=1 Tax=marine sediment metagenome TaxID=412755 RepID=A0A0F9IJ95_9ZZZZ
MDTASDLERLEQELSTPSNGTRPNKNGTRPETVRLRGRLDEVMARLHSKLEIINGDSEAIAQQLDPKATRLARKAFSLEDLELEEVPDDNAT